MLLFWFHIAALVENGFKSFLGPFCCHRGKKQQKTSKTDWFHADLVKQIHFRNAFPLEPFNVWGPSENL